MPLFLLLLALVALTHTNSLADGKEYKIGVVALEQILAELPGRAEVEKKLSEEFAALKRDADARWTEVASLSENLKAKEHALNEAGLAKYQEELIRKETSLSDYWNSTAEKIRARTEEASALISQRVEGDIIQFAIDNAYDFIFDKKSGKLIYAAEKFDCTEQAMRVVLSKEAVDSTSVESTTDQDH